LALSDKPLLSCCISVAATAAAAAVSFAECYFVSKRPTAADRSSCYVSSSILRSSSISHRSLLSRGLRELKHAANLSIRREKRQVVNNLQLLNEMEDIRLKKDTRLSLKLAFSSLYRSVI
jgi:hypothetical protein